MPARAIWKGTLRIPSARAVDVKLYSAIEDRRVHFHLLHAEDMVRVQQRMAHPVSGETVAREDARRGFEIERGRFVLLDDDELEEVEPPASRDVEITHFVPGEAIDPRWYDRPYYLGPDAGATDSCRALAEALERSGREGVARWTMRKRGYVGALRGRNGVLELVALRHAGSVVRIADLPKPEGQPIADKELRLAHQLVEAMTAAFDPEEFRDEYRERVMELIEAKRSGEPTARRKFKSAPSTDRTLERALRESVSEAG